MFDDLKPVGNLERHPYSQAWDTDFQVVSAIAERLKEGDKVPPIDVLHGYVVDGWHRVLAARRTGKELPIRYVTDSRKENLVRIVLNGNMLRRRLSAEAATKLAIKTLIAAGHKLSEQGQSNQIGQVDPFTTNDQIASMCGVSVETVKRAREKIRQEDPEYRRQKKEKKNAALQSLEAQSNENQARLNAQDQKADQAVASARDLAQELTEMRIELQGRKKQMEDPDNPNAVINELEQLRDAASNARQNEQIAHDARDKVEKENTSLRTQNANLRNKLQVANKRLVDAGQDPVREKDDWINDISERFEPYRHVGV